MKRILFILVSLALVIGLMPVASVVATNGGVEPFDGENIAWIPNAGEATVSKVDLVGLQEVARYYTVDPALNDPTVYADVNYRVARLAIDSGGNAWALNTMTGQAQSVHLGQGSVARISANPVPGENPGVTTSNSSAVVADDVRVTVFPLGVAGDCPRTISIVEESGVTYLWIGFWNGKYFQKYKYDPDVNTLEPVVGESIGVSPATPYQAVLDGNGIMWISSRSSSPFPQLAGVMGVFLFDTNDLDVAVVQLTYAPPENQANPYSITVASDGKVWVSNGGNWNTSEVRSFAVYTYGNPDPVYCSTGISTEAMRGFIEYDGHIWATAISGQVLKGTFANGGCPTWELVKSYPRLTAGGGLTGIGPDVFGNLWLVHFDDDVLYGFNPDTLDDLGPIAVGSGPYAYDNFIQFAPPTGEIGDFVWHDLDRDGIQDAGEPGIAGVTVNLWSANETTCEPIAIIATNMTDAIGYYLFDGLRAGNYRVQFVLPAGYNFTQPFAGTNTTIDSNADPVTGISDCIILAAGESNRTIDAGMYMPTFKICGYKYYEEVGGLGIPDWPIKLYAYNVTTGESVYITDTTTDACGHYCFEGLEAGTYLVKEVMQTHWTPVGPTQHEVTLPNGEAVSYNFVNERKPYDDTVWAYGEALAKANNKVKGNPSSAWGWTNRITNTGTYVFDLYAGAAQNDITKGKVVGNVTVAYNGTCVTVTYAIDPDLPYDYTLTEAHLWIGDTELPTEEVKRGRRIIKTVTAAPGQFPYRPEIADDGLSATFTLCGVDAPFWVAAHGVVQWYKVPAPVSSCP